MSESAQDFGKRMDAMRDAILRESPLAVDLEPVKEAADERGEALGPCHGCGRPAYHQAPPPYRPFWMCDVCVVPFAKAVKRFERKTRPRKMATKIKRRK